MKEDVYITVAFNSYFKSKKLSKEDKLKLSKEDKLKLKAAFIAGWKSKGIYENMKGF